MARQGQTRAFTLIELLVVVAILALLISILLPALGRAKENGRRAACLSNLHQLGQAFQQYLHEYNDVLPIAAMLPSVESVNPDDELYHPPITTFLQPYAKFPDLYRCRSDMPGKTKRTTVDPNNQYKSFWETEGTSYQYTPLPAGLADVLGEEDDPGIINVGDVVVKITPELSGHPWHHFRDMKTSQMYVLTEYESFHGKRGTSKIRNTLYADLHVEEYLLADPNDYNPS